jgi:hypothetical protein
MFIALVDPLPARWFPVCTGFKAVSNAECLRDRLEWIWSVDSILPRKSLIRERYHMSEKKADSERISEEFQRFGENLVRALEAAWESEDLKRLTQEIQNGVKAFGTAVETAAKEALQSPSARKAREEIEQFSERIQSGEAAIEIREGILKTLKRINADLEEAAERWKAAEEGGKNE